MSATLPEERARKGRSMEVLWFLGFIALWFVLQMWVLPKFGVPT